ncbi:P-loop containing nucleoside triphosphate hydrolase protein, partial [Schizothecium vesticola]
SGKSSATLALFRLLNLQSGIILVDGIDISTVSKQIVRSNITTVPQDPFFVPTIILRYTLLSGSLGGDVSNSQLAGVLELVGLLQHATIHLCKKSDGKKEDAIKSILDATISALPLSAGQQQLFCLARALLQDKKIVNLDEVTSAIDIATEERLYIVLRNGLKGKTVLMVAHRPK